MKTILFIDDEPYIIDGLRRTLRPMRHEWTVVFASNGAEALELIGQQPFDVIVTDMRMPGMSGIELLKRAIAVSPRSVRIMLTGNADQQTSVDASNEGQVFRFLTKPCLTDLMLKTLHAALEQSP